ncbi:hypothetical protein TruAng_003653 [Truncatella angustata]|nr:hypothetical protein TruAng_003653 [Truncatella angustata]
MNKPSYDSKGLRESLQERTEAVRSWLSWNYSIDAILASGKPTQLHLQHGQMHAESLTHDRSTPGQSRPRPKDTLINGTQNPSSETSSSRSQAEDATDIHTSNRTGLLGPEPFDESEIARLMHNSSAASTRNTENRIPGLAEPPLPPGLSNPYLEEDIEPKEAVARQIVPRGQGAPNATKTQDNLELVLGDWRSVRKALCSQRMGISKKPWLGANWESSVKPLIAVAHELDVHVDAFRRSPYCPEGFRLRAPYVPEAPGPSEPSETDTRTMGKADEQGFIGTLRKAIWTVYPVVKQCEKAWPSVERSAAGSYLLWDGIAHFQQMAERNRTDLEKQTRILRAVLERNGVIPEETSTLGELPGDAFGFASSPGRGVKNEEYQMQAVRRTTFVYDTRLGFDPTALWNMIPARNVLRYQMLKRRFRSVPISTSAPVTVLKTPPEPKTKKDDLLVRTKPAKQGKSLKAGLDDTDRARIREAIAAYQQLREQLSSQTDTNANLLRHKISTRITQYEGRLRGRTHMKNGIKVQIDHHVQVTEDRPSSETPTFAGPGDVERVGNGWFTVHPRPAARSVAALGDRSDISESSSDETLAAVSGGEEQSRPHGPLYTLPRGDVHVSNHDNMAPRLGFCHKISRCLEIRARR